MCEMWESQENFGLFEGWWYESLEEFISSSIIWCDRFFGVALQSSKFSDIPWLISADAFITEITTDNKKNEKESREKWM